MSGNTIYVVKKGDHERVTTPDLKSAQDLMYALNILDCYEPISRQVITGNRQNLPIFEVTFLDRAVKVVGQNDAEKVVNWMLTFGCKKTGIEKIGEIDGEDNVL